MKTKKYMSMKKKFLIKARLLFNIFHLLKSNTNLIFFVFTPSASKALSAGYFYEYMILFSNISAAGLISLFRALLFPLAVLMPVYCAGSVELPVTR
ncbi:MAG: hypothetical protein ACOC3T_04080 [Bacteroidota bacterium]